MSYEEYQTSIRKDVADLIAGLQCQPVLFLGSGISRRYFEAPSWVELLQQLAAQCPGIEKEYAYYAQSCTSEPQIAAEFAKYYREWAWGSGRNRFPESLFAASVKPDAFIKHSAASIIKEKTPQTLGEVDSKYTVELEALKSIQPHAVITTNYDQFLEMLFPEHTPIIGQSALRGMPFTIGEIYKIHGCVTQPEEIVLTTEDYETFSRKKKFIAARLLSLFNEHPLLIAGYSATDQNVRALLGDIDEALALPGDLIENIYFVEYDPKAESKASLPTEKLIQIEENRSVRVKLIVTSDLRWVFQAFKSPEIMNSIPPSTLRALLARSYDLVRSDFPRKTLEVDFKFLEQKLENPDEFAELFGITTISDASIATAAYPLSTTELGQKLGGTNWHKAHRLIQKVKEDTGVDLKGSDNKYHRYLRLNKSQFHKYSHHALSLLKRVEQEGKCDPDWLDMPEKSADLFSDKETKQ